MDWVVAKFFQTVFFCLFMICYTQIEDICYVSFSVQLMLISMQVTVTIIFFGGEGYNLMHHFVRRMNFQRRFISKWLCTSRTSAGAIEVQHGHFWKVKDSPNHPKNICII